MASRSSTHEHPPTEPETDGNDAAPPSSPPWEDLLHRRKQAEASPVRSQALLRLACAISKVGAWVVEVPGGETIWTDELRSIIELAPDAPWALEQWLNAYAPEHRDRVRAAFGTCVRQGLPFDEQARFTTARNRSIWVRVTGEAVRDASGHIVQVQGAMQDISQHTNAQAAPREGGERFRDMFQDAAIGITFHDLESRFLDANDSFCAMLGYTRAELLATSLRHLTHPGDREGHDTVMAEVRRAEPDPKVEERRCIARDGRTLWLRMSLVVQRDAQGYAIGMVSMAEDVTQRRLAQAELERSQGLLRLASKISRVGAWSIDVPTMEGTWSTEIKSVFEMEPDEVCDPERVAAMYAPEHREEVRAAFDACLSHGTALNMEVRFITAKGRSIWLRVAAEAILNADGRVTRLQGAAQNITQRKIAEESLRLNEERFRLVAKATTDAMWDWDMPRNLLWWNEGLETLFGVRREDAPPGLESWTNSIHPDEVQAIIDDVHRSLDAGHGRWTGRYRFRRGDGSYCYVEDRACVIRDTQGTPIRMVGGMTDLSDRLALEDQLRQAKRLELVGQLTGGVAHDFNNLLTVITGNAEMLIEQLPEASRASLLAGHIGEAAQRGAQLTRQLLAFGRRQDLNPEAVDANHLIGGVNAMMQRTLGPNIDVRLISSAGLWHSLVDPGQLEAALLNLCINARDAMPDGGRLTIETANTELSQAYADQHADVVPGIYVMVAVSDTGSGIDPAHLGRVFEPFFTTKEKGKGTGLGLSMVYGFVKQSQGHIGIYSELGHGTTVRMYLPRADAIDVAAPRPKTVAVGGTETILLVEDDAMVRSYANDQLVALGYRVIAAADGPSALARLHQHEDIALLFTDVMMPGGMNGRQLGEAALRLRPGLKLLFTSGYADNALQHHGRLAPGMHLLSKPYHLSDLAHSVREALAADGHSAQPGEGKT